MDNIIDDWYDKAIAAGQGFKSEEERQNYIKEIGDPMKHPLFADNTEDLEGNPLAEALRCLREEDKTPIEIATMYKDEGNDWMKKGDKKSLNEAYDRYTHAISVLEGTKSSAVSGASNFDAGTGMTESPSSSGSSVANTVPSLYPEELLSQNKNKQASIIAEESERNSEEIIMLKSQILSNRCMISLTLKNYASCIRDADTAIILWPANIKAHYRKCRALVALRKFDEGSSSCLHALTIEPSNVQIIALNEKCFSELEKILSDLKIKALKQTEIEQKWKDAYTIILREGGAKGTDVNVGYAAANQQPAQLKEVLPHYTETNHPVWPVIILYPQYGQLDVIEGLDIGDMLAMHLAEMFPELADLDSDSGENGMAVSWDTEKEYQVSRLAVYAQLEATPRIKTLEKWLDSCREQSALRGEMDVEINDSAQVEFKRRSTEHELKLSYSKQKTEEISKAKSSSSSKVEAVEFDKVGYLDVHLGCTFKDILKAPGHVLPGGLITLLVFVRNNKAHVKFLENVTKSRHGVWSLSPNNVIQKLDDA